MLLSERILFHFMLDVWSALSRCGRGHLATYNIHHPLFARPTTCLSWTSRRPGRVVRRVRPTMCVCQTAARLWLVVRWTSRRPGRITSSRPSSGSSTGSSRTLLAAMYTCPPRYSSKPTALWCHTCTPVTDN